MEGVLFVRAAESDVRARHNERRSVVRCARGGQRRINRINVEPIDALHMPPVRLKAFGDVLGEGDVGGGREGDAIRVV